jgi:hypothetical protein
MKLEAVSKSTFMLDAVLFLGLLFNPVDGGDMVVQTLTDFHRTARLFTPEDITVLRHCFCSCRNPIHDSPSNQ